MGLPQVIINFATQAVSAVTRSQKGIVALILADDTVTTFDTKVYQSISEVSSSDWTATNKDYISLAFLGTPSKVIVERVAATPTVDYTDALARLANKKWNYLAIPAITTGDVATISTWIKGKRDTDKKTFKAVLPNSVSDHEGIINFTTDNIVTASKTYTTAEYCARIAGLVAGTPFTQSITYKALSEVTSITETTTPDTDIDAGKLILVNDGTQIKVGRGVNSLTTTTVTKGAAFKKIKIVDGIDQVRDDVRTTFEDSYVGDVINNYDNKLMFVSALNGYFKGLANDDVLDRNANNIADIDAEAQRTYLQSKGVDVSALTDEQIKTANTDSTMFIKASLKFVDCAEDLQFNIAI